MSGSARRTRVWDLPTRIVHWLLVACFAFSWWSAEYRYMDWHRLSGHLVLGLLLFRLYWGFAGSSTARFSDFVRGPRAILRYARQLLERPGEITPGHNPMGGWSVLLLLGLLLLQTGSGLFAVDTDGIESGPLSRYVSYGLARELADFHELSFNLLLAAVGLHLGAIAFYFFYKRQNLVAAMIGGDKPVAASAERPFTAVPWWRAAAGAAVAAALSGMIFVGFSF